jgi:hypothetical protein
MTLSEIKTAVNQGKVVHWQNELYRVMCDTAGHYLIVCQVTPSSAPVCWGLTHRDGTTLNGAESEFYIAEESVDN